MDDIVKQIILRFKTEGAEQTRKAVETLSRGVSGKELEKVIKAFEQAENKFAKMGKTLTNDFKKVKDIFNEINEKEFKKLERNFNRYARLLDAQIKKYGELQQAGADAAQITQLEQRIQKTSQRLQKVADVMPAIEPTGLKGFILSRAPNKVGGPLGYALGSMAIIGGAATGIGTAAGAYRDTLIREAESKISVANVLKQQALDIYSGNMSRQILFADPERAKKINEETKKLTTTKDVEVGLTTAGTGIAGLASVLGAVLGKSAIAAGAAKIGLGALATGAAPFLLGAAGIAGLGYAGKKAYDYFLGGGREVAKEQARTLAEQKAASETMDLEFYRSFYEKSPMRYEYQRQLGLGSIEAVNFRTRMRTQNVLNEEEMASMALGFRRFGVQSATDYAVQAAKMAKETGMSRNTVANLMQSIAMVNRGGVAEAKKDLEELFTKAVSAGIADSGLAEEYQKAIAILMQNIGTRMTAADLSKEFNKFLVNPGDVRGIQGAMFGLQAYGQTLKGVSPLMQAKSTATMLNLAKDKQGRTNLSVLQYLDRLTPEQLATLDENDPVLKLLGLSNEELSKRIRESKQGIVEGTLKSSLGAGSPRAKGSLQNILKKASRGEALSEGEQILLAQEAGFTGNIKDINAVQSFLSGALGEKYGNLKLMGTGGNVIDIKSVRSRTPEEASLALEKIKSTVGKTESSLEAQQVKARAEGEMGFDIKTYDSLSKNMDKVITLYSEHAAKMRDVMERGDLAGSVENISVQLDRLAQALENAANRISGTGSLPFFSRSNPGQGGR